ncbi:hypothetical protein ACKUB1_02150 [Methanospirillum stamsii]|uniref:Uncharacterized protein n=1 Tax=Methanospirillum stamsii TaxID=1277351 RepID=A0A2V2MX73_9EURY|nr:hypothetical protein [Methanospirillum stamsii]PWR70830.1 hypothetical protein DLD82_15190 [Methanospirillum stamsii]
MIPPDNSFRDNLRKERIWFVKKSVEWVNSVPNEIWSKEQCDFIDSLFSNRKNFPLTREQYLHMIEKARSLSTRRKGNPPMPAKK